MRRSNLFSGKYLSSLTIPLFFIFTLAVTGTCFAQTFVSFDGPLAGNQSGDLFTAGTFPVAINRWGCIGLMTVDNNGLTHSFVREPNGKYVTVHPPKAKQTFLAGINASGQVAGSFIDYSGHEHGYVRNADGTYTQLDATGAFSGTRVAGINNAGQVVGNLFTGISESFFWDPSHPDTYVVFTAPEAVTTVAAAINASGQIAGIFIDNSALLNHGFLRNADGTFAKFRVAGSPQMTVDAMNDFGTITGNSYDQGVTSGFLRYSGGGIKFYGAESHGGPQPAAINNHGVVVGYMFSDGGGNAAFSVDRSLTVSFISVPFSNTATTASGINDVGQIVGTYTDSNGVSHGWLEQP
jgi:hypothetical protein